MKEWFWFGTKSRTALALGFSVLGCEPTVPAEHPMTVVPSASATGAVVAQPAEPTAETTGTAWSYDAPARAVPEMQGKPVVLASGARCKTFRHLPSTRFTESTLVRDACIDIPSDTLIEVSGGTTLVIIATNALRLGKNVVFSAKGTRGDRGARADFASVPLNPSSDAEIRTLCVEHGNQCACPQIEASLAPIRGHTGGSGVAGGSVRLIAAELVSFSKLSGLAIDVSGGPGGPPGDSGTRDCVRGEVRCSSPVCSTGAATGAPGADGSVFAAFGGAHDGKSLERVKASTVPSAATTTLFVVSDAMLANQIGQLEHEAVQKGWQRTAGDDFSY